MTYDNDDNMFKALRQFIEDFGHEYDSIDEAVEEFLSYYQKEAKEAELQLTPEEESMDMFELALSTVDKEERHTLIEEAIKLWPENWDAHIELLEGSIKDQIEELLKLESKAKFAWYRTDRQGWVNTNERPYMRLKYLLAMLLYKNGLLLEARGHLEELYAMDAHDNLGCRYMLMAIHCRLYDWQSALTLYNTVPYEAHYDDRMIVPLLVLAILLNKTTYANDLFIDLDSANSSLYMLFEGDHWPVEDILSYVDSESYQANSFSSLALALADILPVVIGSDYLYEWMYDKFYNLEDYEKVNVTDKVISFEAASKQYGDSKVDIPEEEETNEEVEENIEEQAEEEEVHIDHHIFEGVNQKFILFGYGFHTLEDFAKVTEDELLAMKYIGPKTIESLKANGIRFKHQ